MGSGSFSASAYSCYKADNSLDRGISTAFTNTTLSASADIKNAKKSARTYNTNVDEKVLNVGVRECRDSEEHPNVTPIIIAFDVTGSMGRIPYAMVNDLLPKLMDQLKQINVPDPELLFMGIGDHEYDHYPLQITQFESDTNKICDALRSIYLERGGGGNLFESYELAWIAAGYHTEIDSWYKRHKKGFLFTIGDEPNCPSVPSGALVKFLGYQSGCKSISAEEAYNKACEQYQVFHIHVNDGYNRFNESWKQILGDHVLRCDSSDIDQVICDTIHKYMSETQPKEEVNSSDKAQYTY